MMSLLDFFRRSKNDASRKLKPTWTEDGVVFAFSEPLRSPELDEFFRQLEGAAQEDALLGTYLSQLVTDGAATIQRDSLFIPWESVYALLGDPEHRSLIAYLGLPPVGALRPVLTHEESLAHPNFAVRIETWVDGQAPVRIDTLTGAVVRLCDRQWMLSEFAWRLADALATFNHRSADARTQHENELGWGRVRALAQRAGAFFASPYLENTIVLTPQTLRLPLTREDTDFGRVLTVAPTFEGAPEDWLRAFDGYQSVRDHYELTQGGRGRMLIVISEPVRKVLEVIKREMPGRKVAGSRAENFVHNPWAFIGEAATEVLDEAEFEEDKAGAGALSAIFSVVPRIQNGRIERVDLIVTEAFAGGLARTDKQPFADPDELEDFVVALDRALTEERPKFPWGEYDLTIDAESVLQLEQAQQTLHLWSAQPAERISLEDIYEMSGYSERIEGIGDAKAIYVPVFKKNGSEEGSLGIPTDLTPMVRVTLQGHEGPVLIPLTKEWVRTFTEKVEAAYAMGQEEVSDRVLPTAVSVAQARKLADSFKAMLDAEDRVRGDRPGERKDTRNKLTLLLKTNFHTVDYTENRRKALEVPPGAVAELPTTLRPQIKLEKHQLEGVAWLQHLAANSPYACRGALLADDMGLGKTLQLLALLGRFYENSPDAPPSLIVAPKSLLENWDDEVRKFFSPSYPKVLVLYGATLDALKQPKDLIDQEVRDKKITDLLKPGWLGPERILITTYENLVRYEFSFARQQFSFLICDEAQRIKTPGTQVALAAKKIKAEFRIACTGTPVENSLADLWCLFDFVQPGLLGALEEFGRTYRRPIECATEEQKNALEQLKSVIAPQILRRTKAELTGLLKRKLFAYSSTDGSVAFKEQLALGDRLNVQMSEYQRALYKGGLKKLRDAAEEEDGQRRARLSFGALHLMKAVCAEPYCLPGTKFLLSAEGLETHLQNSPKLDWLVQRLSHIKELGEKVIIFTEIREIQVALCFFLKRSFGITPAVINGDSQGRQGIINKFSNSSGFNVIVLSTLAAGAGLNITAANHVIHFTRAWNPAKENQATDRAYRLGQDKDVTVYCPTVVADEFVSFEVRLDQLLKQKAGLADAAIGESITAMLNGVGDDVNVHDLMGSVEEGTAPPERILTIDDVDRMDGLSFEILVTLIWERQGFQAFVTPKRGGDGGIDVVALRGKEGVLIQCKSSAKADLGWDAIKEVFAGAPRYRAMYAGTSFGNVAITNQAFTRGAVAQAEATRVRLVERAELEELLSKHPITNTGFERELLHRAAILHAVA